MQINIYKQVFESYFNSESTLQELKESSALLKKSTRIFFIGNGGSNAICSHMMEDFAKIAKKPTFSFSDAALITCFSNDYGYENAMLEWLKIHFTASDTLVAISSSGNSMNILNATSFAKNEGGTILTLSGFNSENKLKKMGDINFHIPVSNYGVVECLHQVILHAILDEITV